MVAAVKVLELRWPSTLFLVDDFADQFGISRFSVSAGMSEWVELLVGF